MSTEFLKNDHTAAELLLWPKGFQKFTPTPDNGIFEALAGDDDHSAIADRPDDDDGEWESRAAVRPRPVGRALHHQRRPLDDAYAQGILGFTPEGTQTRIPGVAGFEFQDDEQESRRSSCAT